MIWLFLMKMGSGGPGRSGAYAMKYLEETEVLIHGYLEGLSVEMLENDDGGTGLIRTRTPDSPDERSLTMVRDSFGAAMEPGAAEVFQGGGIDKLEIYG